MKIPFSRCAALFAFCTINLFFHSSAMAQAETRFMAYPALTPNGQTVIFSYDGDLWKVPAAGGEASRITAMPGNEIGARFPLMENGWLFHRTSLGIMMYM